MNNVLENRKSSVLRIILKNTRYFIFFGLILAFAFASPKFLSKQNLNSLILTTTPFAIATVGMAFVILTGGIDLSVGSILLVSGFIGAYAANAGLSFFLSMFLAVAAGCLAGCLNGLLITKFKLVPFLATLATTSFFRGFILQFGNTNLILLKNIDFMVAVMRNKFLGLPVITWVLIALVILAELLLKRTPFGWHLYAVGNNAEAAAKVGIKADRIKFAAYAICGLLTGIAGFLNMCMLGSVASNYGDGNEFTIISAAVLGGISLLGGSGSVFPGAIVGIVTFTMIENGMTLMSANAYFYTVVRAAVIFIAILIDSITKKGRELR